MGPSGFEKTGHGAAEFFRSMGWLLAPGGWALASGRFWSDADLGSVDQNFMGVARSGM